MNLSPQRIQNLFLAAVELSEAAARDQLLERECAGDPALRQRVEALLRAHDATGGFGDEPSAPTGDAPCETPLAIRPGTILAGRYKLLEIIGEGGMGSVWVAEQSQPVRRKVAIKLVKPGMDSRQVLARFEAERQALALMDHPHIAKVLDGGLTDQGRPFFAMEYVKGVPFTEYCDQARLSLQERLELFLPVCQAVQHAHQKGIIHRDLKPSNILVCLYDGRPVPKVIDFGLAKAMHQSLTEQTLHTAHGMMVGTPLYMSPEQAEYNNLDVDTRTDVYSLGVILYELLTGSTPLERRQLKEGAAHEILRLIKEFEPPRPSTRLSGSASLPSIAAQRRLEPKQLHRSLAGDLDWIVMKALEKERSRRYETANGLARDIERFLRDEAIEARPPSSSYKLQRFFRRHRAVLVTAAAFVLVLLTGTTISVWQALRATAASREARRAASQAQAERDLKVQALAAETAARERASEALQAEERARAAEQSRTEELRQVADFQSSMLARIQLAQAGSRIAADILSAYEQALQSAALPPAQITAQVAELRRQLEQVNSTSIAANMIDTTVLEPAVAALDRQFAQLPLVDAAISESLAEIYCLSVGNYVKGAALAHRSYELRRKLLGENHPDTLRTHAILLQAQWAEGDTDGLENGFAAYYSRAHPLITRLLELHGPDHPATLWSVAKLETFVDERLLQQSYDRARTQFGDAHPLTIALCHGLVLRLAYVTDRTAECESLTRQHVAICSQVLGEGHYLTTTAEHLLLDLTWWRTDQFAAYERGMRDLWNKRKHLFGSRNPVTIHSTEWLSQLLANQGRWLESEDLQRDRVQGYLETLGPNHAVTRTAIAKLIALYGNAGETLRMERFLEQHLTTGLRPHLRSRDDNRGLSATALMLASRYQAQGRPTDAIRVLEEAARHPRSQIGANPLTLALASAYLAAGRRQEAQFLALQVPPRPGDAIPSWIDMSTWTAYAGCADVLNQTDATVEEVEAVIRSMRTIGERVGVGPELLLSQHTFLATSFRNRHRPDEAEALLNELRADLLSPSMPFLTFRRNLVPLPLTVDLARQLVLQYVQQGRRDEAQAFLRAFHRRDPYASEARFSDTFMSAQPLSDTALSLARRDFLSQRARLLQEHGLTRESLIDFEAAVREQQQLRARGGDRAIHQRYLVPLIWQYGVALLHAGQTKAAEERLDEAIALRESLAQAPGRAPIDVRLLASLYLDRARLVVEGTPPEQAQQWLTKAVDTARQVPSAAWIRVDVARIYADQQQLDKALILLERLRDDCRQSSEYWVRDHLSTLELLAACYWGQGRLPAAAVACREAWQLRKEYYGPDHRETIVRQNELAKMHLSLQEFAQAITLFEEIAERSAAAQGRESNDARIIRGNLGFAYKSAGRVAEALPLLAEAWAASDTVPSLQSIGPDLVDAYFQTTQPDPALQVVQQIVDAARRKQGHDRRQTAAVLAKLGVTLLQYRDGAAAEPILRECLEIREQFEPDAWTTANARSLLGDALAGQGKLAEAEPLLLDGYLGLRAQAQQIPPASQSRLPRALERLVILYQRLARPDEAARWQALLEQHSGSSNKRK
ncbi:MAG: serine/threonine-protein kinase [Pirellulales bacterium]